MKRQIPGVFCLEGEWDTDLRKKSSVLPVLELLENQRVIEYIHRNIGTVEELDHYLERWCQQRYEKFRLLYLGFHGEPGFVWVGRKKVPIEHIAELLNGAAGGCTVYFGSCSVFSLPKRQLDDFLYASGAKAICGYTEDVDWIESVAFDLMLIEAFTRYKRVDAAERWLKSQYSGMVRRLGFKVHRPRS